MLDLVAPAIARTAEAVEGPADSAFVNSPMMIEQPTDRLDVGRVKVWIVELKFGAQRVELLHVPALFGAGRDMIALLLDRAKLIHFRDGDSAGIAVPNMPRALE